MRHGLTQWNADQRWQGWADIPLSDLGQRQVNYAARTLAQTLAQRVEHAPNASPDRPGSVRIVSSDLQRAFSTAQAFAEALGVAAIERVEAWRERHVGDWSGLTAREINVRWPGLLDRWRSGEQVELPGGENEPEFRARILRALTTETQRAAEQQNLTVAVSHGGTIRTIESLLGVEKRHVANVGGRWFHWDGTAVVPGAAIDLLDDIGPLDPQTGPNPGTHTAPPPILRHGHEHAANVAL